MNDANSQSTRTMSDERFHLSNRLLFRLYKTVNRLHTSGTKWTNELNLTTQQWSVLGALARAEFRNGISVNDLSAYLQVTRQNLNGVLDRLETQNLTGRTQDMQDRRARLVQLTKKGWKVWHELSNEISGFYLAALQGFSAEELVQFQYLVDKLDANLKKLAP